MRKARIGRLGVALGVLFALTSTAAVTAPVAHAAKAADNTAELKAREAFAAGRYEEALDLFAKLYAQTLHPVYLRNIGRCYQKMRQPERAIDKFNEYLAKDKKISADERKEIDGYVKEMEALRDEQTKQKAPPIAAPPVVTPINPQSPQSPQASPPPAANLQPPPPTTTASATLVAQPSAPDEAPVYKKWWFWTGIGAAVAAGVVVAILVSSGGTTRPDCPSDATCGP